MPGPVRIATRKSALALWQARHVAARLKRLHPGIEVELLPLTTPGDRLLDTPLARIGGKGLFLKELERALLEGEADLAVHSMKDVPGEITPGLEVAVVLERASPFDAFLSRDGQALEDLPAGAVVGTSSLRRQCQLLSLRPDLLVTPLRGNVDTRLEKLQAGDCDAVILACAGLERLGLAGRITHVLEAPRWLPAAAQGVIGLQTRADDEGTRALISPLGHAETAIATRAERRVSLRLGGSCRVPLAAWAEPGQDRTLTVHALVGRSDGSRLLRATGVSSRDDPEAAGEAAAGELIGQGAEAVIREEAGALSGAVDAGH